MSEPESGFKSIDYSDPMLSRILDAAEKCVHRYGIRRTTMGEVARVGKFSRATLYRYFSDKDSLVETVLGRRRELFLNRTEADLEKLPTLVDKLTHSVVTGRTDTREGIFAAIAEVEPETTAMMYMEAGFYERSVDFWPPHIRMAQEAGEVDPALSVELATDFIMRLAVSLVMYPQMGLELHNEDEVREYLRQVLLRGLGTATD